MTLGINSSISSASAVNRNHSELTRTLSQLSSGSKIGQPSDDAAGLAVAMKMSAELGRMQADRKNLSNSQSYLQTQDGALQQATQIAERMSELKVRSADITLNSSDRANYNTEFKELQEQLESIQTGQFNDNPLFADGGSELNIATAEAGEISIDQANLPGGTANARSAASLDDITVEQLTSSIDNIATLRAANGAQSSRLGSAIEMLNERAQNVEEAQSRIVDTDFAEASTRKASRSIQLQASIAVHAHSNISQSAALRLLS